MGMVKMKHINIYGPEQDPQQTLEVLAKLACFHPDKDAERINAAAGAAENLYTPLLASTLGLIKDVGGDPALQEYRGRFFEYGVVKDEVEALSAQVAERGKRQAEISAKLATYAQTKTQLYHLTGLHTSVDEIFACKYLKVRFGRIPKDSYLKLPYYDDHSFTFSEYDFDGEYYWGMYFVPESHAKEVDDIFASLYFERMWVPDFVHGTPQDALAQIMTQESELQAEQKELDNMSDIAAPADIERLREYASWLNYEMQIFDMRKYVITLEHTYYISGYVPESDVERLKQGLLMVHGVKACEDDEADAVDGAPDRQPPVKLKNNWFARPFEMFITMYGLPGYGDLDPTGFVAVTYALLFGIMFGDVGQGVLLGLIAYFVMWKKMHMELGRVVARCSVFSVIFGFLYGSVFGYEHVLDPMFHALGFAEKPLEVLAPEGINNILIASVVAGVLIIVSAIVTGIISNLRKHIIAKTIFSVNGVSGLVFYVSLIALLLPMLGMELTFVGSVPYLILCIAVPFFLMYFAEPLSALCAGEKPEGSVGDILLNGFFEMFDTVLSFASNTMSFLRVGGFVLVHAGMMTVVFTLANMTGGVFYVLIVAVGNVFVMALEALFVGIQVLRLEFYEIFSRFFDANGVPFAPLRISLDPAADKAE